MDNLIAVVLGDIALVLIASQLMGWLARRVGQPTVVGQLLAGILLGPTLLGRLPGHLTSRIFPHSVLPALNVLAQVAVVIFMFVVGYELDWGAMRGRRRAVPMIAAGALLVPMGLAVAAVATFRSGFADLGEPDLSRPFLLFMAVAVSITALPVLAAILRERGLSGTTAGITATAAAGIMDVLAWLVLAAALIGTSHRPGRPWWLTLLILAAFIAAMLLIVRPVLRWQFSRANSLLSNPLPVALVLALGSAWVTSALGLHPVFGGFLAGLTMPSLEGTPDADVLRPMEQLGGLLLPLFFVVMGLSLNVGALNVTAYGLLAVICVIAIAGKMGPAYLMSRLGGLGQRDAATVGTLVSTRGLTELIALNVGLTAGLITGQLFSVLVLMALITTVLTVPILSLIGPDTTPARALAPGAVRAAPGASETAPGRRRPS